MEEATLQLKSDVLGWFQHNIARTIGVCIIGTLLIVLPAFLMYALYHKGYEKGAADYALAHPAHVYNAPVTQTAAPVQSGWTLGIQYSKNWGFGFCHK